MELILSSSKWFYNDEFESFYSANKLMRILKIPRENLYSKLISDFPQLKGPINNMIVFDYIVNNTDRHLKNFGFIEKDDTLRFSPLYDNGLALGSHLDDEDIESEDIEDLLLDSDYAKCFETTNRKQLNLVDNHSLNLDIDFQDILDKYNIYFTKKRGIFISELLKSRIEVVKSCFPNQ